MSDLLCGAIDQMVRKNETLTRQAARIRHELALPENRLLARFFEATNLTESVQTLRDLALESNTHTTAEVQTKVEWLEIFIVGFNAIELTRTVVEHFNIEFAWKLLSILSVGVVSAIATFLILAPWKYGQSKRPWWFLGLLALLYVCAFVPIALDRGPMPGLFEHRTPVKIVPWIWPA